MHLFPANTTTPEHRFEALARCWTCVLPRRRDQTFLTGRTWLEPHRRPRRVGVKDVTSAVALTKRWVVRVHAMLIPYE